MKSYRYFSIKIIIDNSYITSVNISVASFTSVSSEKSTFRLLIEVARRSYLSCDFRFGYPVPPVRVVIKGFFLIIFLDIAIMREFQPKKIDIDETRYHFGVLINRTSFLYRVELTNWL